MEAFHLLKNIQKFSSISVFDLILAIVKLVHLPNRALILNPMPCVLCTFLIVVAVLAGFSPGHVPLGLRGGSRFHHQHLHGGAHLGSLASLLHCHLLHDHRPALLEDWKIGACTERRSDERSSVSKNIVGECYYTSEVVARCSPFRVLLR